MVAAFLMKTVIVQVSFPLPLFINTDFNLLDIGWKLEPR
jgi:hypothetical protein